MRLYNTESRKKELLEGDSIKMYTCGPTVHDYAHIGNFRTFLFEDFLRRSLRFFGYKVVQVMNITDIDDKTIRGAQKEGLSLQQFTERFTEAFFEDLSALNIERAEFFPRATQYIPQMVEMIEQLIDKGYAYRGSDQSIYFSIGKFDSYGRLSHLDRSRHEEGERIECDEYEKESVADFVLWKSYDPCRDGSLFWDTPLGKGRPGWHIECSAMATSLLGNSIDLHVGGVDNIFPHHENEIAQCEACSGVPFVRHWLHCEHLLVNQRKMSKSLGNFFTLRDLLAEGYSGCQIRYLFLQTHYRTPLNFSHESLEAAGRALERLREFVRRLGRVELADSLGLTASLLLDAKEGFRAALSDDLNLPAALGVLFDLVREVNSLSDLNRVSVQEASDLLGFVKEVDQIFGVIFFEEGEEVSDRLRALLEKREEARRAKEWGRADLLREQIEALGYLIEDGPTAPRLIKRGKEHKL